MQNQETIIENNRLIAEPQPGDKIVVWFSCGAASAIAVIQPEDIIAKGWAKIKEQNTK